MMTQQLGFSVLSAPLAAIDRRALSQAWYSALHLANDRPRGQREGVRKPLAEGAPRPSSRLVQMGRACVREGQNAAVRREIAPRAHAAEGDRRSIRSPLARKIERAFLHPMRSTQRVTLALGDGARVHISLQQGQHGVHLVAVCAAAQREAVARALEQARYALALRGIVLRAGLSRGETC